MTNLFVDDIEKLLKNLKIQLKEEIVSELKMAITSSPDLWTEKETRKLTCPPIPRSTIFSWVKQGKITAYKVGKRTYYSKNEVFAFLTACKKMPKNH